MRGRDGENKVNRVDKVDRVNKARGPQPHLHYLPHLPHRAKRYPSSEAPPSTPCHTTFLSAQFLVRRHQIQRSANFEAMGCTWSTAHWRDNSLAAVDDGLSQEINLLSEGVRLGLSQKWAPEDSTQTYSLGCSAFSDGPRMTPYHNKLIALGE